MKALFTSFPWRTVLWLALLLEPASVQAAPPDLTAAGVIATIDRTSTYNLGPTGLRGWIYVGGGNGPDGTMTTESRQILVTVASTPGSGVLAVDDVILGAMAASGGTVPLFSSDSRKAFGTAIGDAESTGAGTLRVKRWRAGTTTDVNLPMAIMGNYADTAPYLCPKSALVLANARNQFVGQLSANPNFLSSDWAGGINGLALLASVVPGYVSPNGITYNDVQTRLQTFAHALVSAGPPQDSLKIWDWGYLGLFLAEYYLSTGDASVLPGISQYGMALAQSQSMYGTFGHNPAQPRPDGTGRLSVIGYGPVNQAGLPANLAMVMGKKALLAGGLPINPRIDSAIQHGSDFFAWYVNKGSIPYGEHIPGAQNHSSNGKDALCAVFFGVQANRLTETEYFTRMTTAGFTGREYGHTGQGFSYLWGALGANMGGSLAVAEYLKKVRWHLDLERRTDGSFVYDGQEQYGAGTTADGTYLGTSSYQGMNSTAPYLLTYALPLQLLDITGKTIPLTLDSTKVANAIAAATISQDCPGFTNAVLIADLSEFDPVVRYYSAIELATRSLSSTELTTLRNMVADPSNANGRMGACQTLGLLNDATALPMITQRLDKTREPDPWVRATAASALRSYGAAASTQRDPMLTSFSANATDPDVIVWSDPLQASNSMLSFALFGDSVYGGNDISTYTINASKSLLYPAVKAGLKQPDSYPRQGVSDFAYTKLTLADVQALPLEFINNSQYECQVDRMWSPDSRAKAIMTLGKWHFSEGIPLALAMLEVPASFEYGSSDYVIPALNVLAGYGDAARWTLPTLRGYLTTWDPLSSQSATLATTIATLEAATTSPTGITRLNAAANSQIMVTTGSKAITLSGSSCRDASVSYTNVTAPAHGTLTGSTPFLTYTPMAGYTGPDHFTFQTADSLTSSEPATVSIIVGTAGTGLKGEYFDNMDFTNLKLTRSDAQVNFDWGTGSPDPALGADTFSVRWSGLVLVPETGNYTFSTLNSDGLRLYLNGVLVIDDYVDQATHWTDGVSLSLTAGQLVDLQLEYYENTGSAVAKLKWTGPSFAGANGAIITKEWLSDGTGVTNRTSYAHAQTVSLVQNTPQAITLTGSGGTLTYALVTPPAHGTLTGIAPNLTYTPAANYSGTDSFTFLVNNGSSNSTPASVSISVWAGQPLTYTWSYPVPGNWSGTGNWISGTAPAASGQPFYNLNFNSPGTYTVTHDLNNGFQLNQLSVGAAVTCAGTNSLTFAANGPILPQLNQNSANTVSVNTPLNLAAMTLVGGSGGGSVILSSLISGSGGLTKNSSGTLTLNHFVNTYSGGTVLNAGTVSLAVGDGSLTPFFGTGPLTMNSNATLAVDRTNLTNPITLNGATVTGGDSFSSDFGGPVTLTGITTIDLGTTGGFSISGNISGTGGLITVGTTQWSLSGSNSYTGPTTIQAGTLRYLAAAAVAPAALIIATGGKANLSYSGNRVVASLVLAGTAMPPGSYGSSTSSATNKNDTYFSSAGMVTVLPATTTALTLTGGATPSSPGTSLTFTATVSGNSPTGTVVFYDGTTPLGTASLNGLYQASVTTSSLALGSHSMTAQYAGNATTAASSSAAVAIEIVSLVPAAPANLLAAPGNNHVGLSWSLATGATGYHVWRSLSNGGPYTVIANPGNGMLDDLTAANGTTYFYVVSAINASGESANSSQVSALPAVQASTTTLASSPFASGPYGTAVTFTATVSVLGAPASGTVTFKEGTTVLATATLSAGLATFATSTLAVANHLLTATYGGDTTITGSISGPCAYAVTAKGLTLTGVTAANTVYDGTLTAVLAGGALAGVINGETVTVVAGTGTFARPNVGTWAVTATGYALAGANAANYVLAAQPAVPNATITLGDTRPPTTTRTYNLGPQGAGTTIQVATGPGSMGNLIPWITPGTLPLCSVLRSVSATIRLDSSTGASGCNDFFLYFDANPAAAGTAALMQVGGDYSGKVGTVAQKLPWGMGWGGPGSSDATVTTKIVSLSWSGDIDLNAFELSLGNNYATSTWSGTVTVEYDVSGPPTVPANLLATPGNSHIDLTWTASQGVTGYQVKRSLTSGGSYTVIASPTTESYTDLTAINGTTYYYVVSASNVAGESANSNQVSATAALAPSTTTLVLSSLASGSYGTPVTFTATVAVSGAPATGTVTFNDGLTVLGSGNLSAGTATFSTSTLALASHAITASYTGDGTYAGSVSAASAYLVTAKVLTLSGVSAADKVYDGNATAALTGGTLSGVSNGETVTVVAGSGTFASPNAGTQAVTVTGYSLGGANAGNYHLAAQPTVPNATISQRPIQLTGSRAYDATPLVAAANLTISNKLSGDDLTLTGSATLDAKDAGTRGLLSGSLTPARVQSATGSTGATAATAFGVNLTSTPVAGNTLVAVISTRGTAANQVSGISQTSSTWSRAAQTANPAGTTTEIWFAANVPATAGTTVTITLATSLYTSAVVVEYSGVLTANPLDQSAGAFGNSISASTGTTAITAQANELWIGGIGLNSSTFALGTPANAFTSVASAQSASSTASNNASVYALESISGGTAAAASGGAITGVLAGSIAVRGTATSASGTTSLSISKPTGVVAGDVMIATFAKVGNTTALVAPSGWTLINGAILRASSTLIYGAVMYRVANATDTGVSSYTFPMITGTTSANGGIVAFSGVDSSGGFLVGGGSGGPFDGVPGTIQANTGGSLSVNATGIITATANAAVLMCGMAGSTVTWSNWTTTSPGTLAEVLEGPHTASGSVGMAWAIKASAGATGSGTATLSVSQRNGGLLLALRSAASVPQWSGAIATFKATPLMNLALAGTAAANYTLAGATGALQITPKALGLTPIPAVTGKTYDGLTAAVLTGAALPGAEAAGAGTSSDGKPYTGDAVGLTLSGSFNTKDVGIGKAATSTSTLTGARAGDYSLTQPSGLTGTITPAILTITADNQSKTYGQTLGFGSGATQFTSGGLWNGETIGSVTLTCTGGDATAAVASYPITPGAATGGTFTAGNYSIGYVAGTLTVNPLTMAAYQAWAGGASFDTDANGDGVANGLAWLLGATDPSANASALLPKPTSAGGKLVLTFRCLKPANRGAAGLKVQYSNNLGAANLWASQEAEVPDAGGTVGGMVFAISPDADLAFMNVRAEIPADAASPSGKLFGRLYASGE